MLLQHFQEETSMNAKLFKAALMGHFVFLRSATEDTQSNYSNYLQQIKARNPRVRSMVWPQSQSSTLSQLWGPMFWFLPLPIPLYVRCSFLPLENTSAHFFLLSSCNLLAIINAHSKTVVFNILQDTLLIKRSLYPEFHHSQVLCA